MHISYFPALLISILLFNSLNAQVADDSELFKILATNDSLLFERGFNKCEVQYMDSLTHADFEFYHDQSGITDSKEIFVTGIKEGLCKLPYKARRELVASSLKVFPMYNNGVLYGALQMGEHYFYAKYPDKEKEIVTSTAKFTHVWQLIDGKWKFTRALSYDHQTPED